jgi:hypothetical protein
MEALQTKTQDTVSNQGDTKQENTSIRKITMDLLTDGEIRQMLATVGANFQTLVAKKRKVSILFSSNQLN